MMFLSKLEIKTLTGRKRKDAQARVLRFMGVEHKMRPDGSVAVLRSHVERLLGGVIINDQQPEIEPNWSVFARH